MTLLHSSLFCFVKATLDSTQDNCTETFSFCMLILLVSLTNFMYTYIYISKPFMIFQRSKLRINRSHMRLKFRICDLNEKPVAIWRPKISALFIFKNFTPGSDLSKIKNGGLLKQYGMFQSYINLYKDKTSSDGSFIWKTAWDKYV